MKVDRSAVTQCQAQSYLSDSLEIVSKKLLQVNFKPDQPKTANFMQQKSDLFSSSSKNKKKVKRVPIPTLVQIFGNRIRKSDLILEKGGHFYL